VKEESVKANPFMDPNLSKVTELLINRNTAENNRELHEFITNAADTSRIHSATEL